MNVLMLMIIDGKNAVLGRLAAQVAKRLLKGEEVIIVNADKTIITGNPDTILAEYTTRRQRGSTEFGPYYPKTPDAIVRRTVRGMLPYKTGRGREAFKKLRVHIDIPAELKIQEIVSAPARNVKSDFMTLEKVSTLIGWKRV